MTLTLAYVVWMTNLYNFMDGLDGFAGGMTVVGFGALAVLGWLGEAPAYAAVAVVIAAAAGGFLTRNLPPAQLFLGDVGSSTLGLAAAAMTRWGSALGLFPLWVGWLAFSPFIVDATWTLVRRIIRRESFWRPHRSHHYQRLALAGWGHRRVLLWSYALMAAAAASAVGSGRMSASEQWLLLLAWAAVYTMIHYRVGLAERVTQAARS
jgi:UDP-N-acetylmuramyl pentapeptide phosphotransferase/UDP-N-acetylglucosamine-1-phosphate transferase